MKWLRWLRPRKQRHLDEHAQHERDVKMFKARLQAQQQELRTIQRQIGVIRDSGDR